MAQLESSFKNMIIVLSVIAFIAAGTLASVYEFTKAPIEASKLAKQQNAIKDVLPKTFDHLAEPIEIQGADKMVVYKAYDAKNEFIGAAIESSSNNGFSGKITVMVGFDKDGNIVNYSVLEQK
ncbi:MAG: electron transporter RnfG, partial [Paludibacter sp.]